MSTIIKRLKQNNQEFVPITLAEAVVVNTEGIPNTIQEITTLDKVLRRFIAQDANVNQALETINTTLLTKQDKLKEGYGIKISEDNEISVTLSYTLYQIVTTLPEASEEVMNTIYLVISPSAEQQNYYSEYVCLYDKEKNIHFWEKLGTFKADVDLSGYVTNEIFYNYAITAENIKTSQQAGNANVYVNYDIPATLYDDAVTLDQSDYVV